MISLKVPNKRLLAAAAQDQSLGGEQFELRRVTLSSEMSLESWGSFRGDHVEGCLGGRNHRSKGTEVGKPLTALRAAQRVSSKWPGGENHVSKVLECQAEEVGPCSGGDGEAGIASNLSSILGRSSWPQLKSAIQRTLLQVSIIHQTLAEVLRMQRE